MRPLLHSCSVNAPWIPASRPSCHARVAAEPESHQLDRKYSRARTGNEPDNDHTNTPTATQIGRLFLLSFQVERVLEDGVLDDDEGQELHDALMNWTGGGGADGEESTTALLPLDPAPRAVPIPGNIFVFTGTGVFGTRRVMQDATIRAGGTVERNITMQTNFVVLGTYVTPAWAHQSFG